MFVQTSRVLLCWFSLGLFWSAEAWAHQLQFVLTELHWRVDEQRLEVSHSMHMDDALPMLAAVGAPRGDISVETRARLLLYVEDNFQLRLDGQLLALKPIGAQVQGDYLWLFQEHELNRPPVVISVTSRMLHGLMPTPQHHINWRVGRAVKTLQLNHQLDQGELRVTPSPDG